MAFGSVVTMEKPMQHLALADWHSRLTQLRNVADARRTDAFHLRHTARTLRNETRIEANWINYDTNVALADRRAELERWRLTVYNTLQRIEKEMHLLREEKYATEEEIQSMITPLVVVSECLTQRDGRLGAELTYDEGDTELKKELCVVEHNTRQLRDQCQATWEKLNRLEDVKFKLSLEVINKKEAEVIDIAQLALDRTAANITYKPDATRVPKNSVSYEAWLEHTRNMKQLADNELADTYSIRESLFVCREKAKNILKSQQDRTEHIIRKRIFETQRARNELEWQKLKMKDEMEKTICEIQNLEQALRDKTDALKLAETRLENRAQRAGLELCLDEPYEKLVKEVTQMRKIRQILNDKIDCAKTTYGALEEHAVRIDDDLNNKQHALMVDMRGLDLRKRINSGPIQSETDRNIQLTKMEHEIPPV